jgi:hypothetical protein
VRESKGKFDRISFGLLMWGSGVSSFPVGWLATLGASFFGGAKMFEKCVIRNGC